jgi:hypothetical protein
MIRRLVPLLTFALFSHLLVAQEEPLQLAGKVEGNTYISANGAFRVTIPVLPELGGTIDDNENVVTFQDGFSVHATIASFPLTATLRLENEMSGRKEFLISFFKNQVQPDFKRRFPGMTLDAAVYLPSVQEGAMITYFQLPGGSMFNNRLFIPDGELPVAKRGALLFVKEEFIFIISVELAEKVFERTSYKKTVDEENDLLRARLLDLLGKVSFTMPKKGAKTAAPAETK